MITRLVLLTFLYLAAPSSLWAASDAMLFQLFLTDGTSVISYGEFARVADRVVFSMVMGGGTEPRLHAATLPASAIDWARTDRHSASTRYQWYAQTRGEDDFLLLSNGVASVLNDVLLTPDRTRALQVAQQARTTLAEWPRQHYGYRQQDVQEILLVLDEAISDLRAAAGMTSFDLALVAPAPEIILEPLATMPTPRDQLYQAFRVAALAGGSSERVALFRTALMLLDEAGTVIPPADAEALRRFAATRIREEEGIDAQYGEMTRRLMSEANRAAERAQIGDVERVLQEIPREDTRLGRRRPEVVESLRTSVQAQLDSARRLRLRRDQWAIRRTLYRDYQSSVGAQLLQLVKAQPALEAIRRLEGPDPDALAALQARLSGGTEQLGKIRPPVDLRVAHDLLVGAWRFAESAVNGRLRAAGAANLPAAWEASSAAAGALMLLSRAQLELRELLEPPQLQ